MSYKKKAVIEVENQGDEGYAHYFYIDYEPYTSVDAVANQTYFHVQWHSERNTQGWAYEEGLTSETYRNDPRWQNLSDTENFVMCDIEGNGIYCGAHLDIDCFQRNPNDWYGEGNDLMLIDGESWPPSLHGTGTEDWYHCAYCPTQECTARITASSCTAAARNGDGKERIPCTETTWKTRYDCAPAFGYPSNTVTPIS